MWKPRGEEPACTGDRPSNTRASTPVGARSRIIPTRLPFVKLRSGPLLIVTYSTVGRPPIVTGVSIVFNRSRQMTAATLRP